jgi:hypothetical protein
MSVFSEVAEQKLNLTVCEHHTLIKIMVRTRKYFGKVLLCSVGYFGPITQAHMESTYTAATTTDTTSDTALRIGDSGDVTFEELVEIFVTLEIIPQEKAELARTTLRGLAATR